MSCLGWGYSVGCRMSQGVHDCSKVGNQARRPLRNTKCILGYAVKSLTQWTWYDHRSVASGVCVQFAIVLWLNACGGDQGKDREEEVCVCFGLNWLAKLIKWLLFLWWRNGLLCCTGSIAMTTDPGFMFKGPEWQILFEWVMIYLDLICFMESGPIWYNACDICDLNSQIHPSPLRMFVRKAAERCMLNIILMS